jgi:A/G-specific adenine glycosylase
VLVSEIMLQQTPVVRVLPVWQEWMERWPTPAALAAEPSGEAVRAWGRLGYPRRALRLHGCAAAIVERHGGEVPSAHEELLALPGVGAYTAAAVASFAFRRRHAVLDTNVRRVLARMINAAEYPAKAQTSAEVRLAESMLPVDPPVAARWAVAAMELGALVCTARSPRCVDCPVIDICAWQRAGRPAYDGPPRKGQTYAGTDRQCRGRLLAVLRHAEGPVDKPELDIVWSDALQRERALDGLIADGLVDPLDDGRYALPGTRLP